MSEVQRQINQLSISGVLDPSALETEFHFPDGRVVRVLTALLHQTADLNSMSELHRLEPDQIMIPVIEEQLEVSKRVVKTGTVHLHKSVETYDVTLNEPLAVEEWRVERVSKNEVVGEAPVTRQEGETTVYPVVEERLVLTKELMLVEEIRVTRTLSERRDTQTVTLRREKIDIDRENLSS